jgi:hypothetical protein
VRDFEIDGWVVGVCQHLSKLKSVNFLEWLIASDNPFRDKLLKLVLIPWTLCLNDEMIECATDMDLLLHPSLVSQMQAVSFRRPTRDS